MSAHSACPTLNLSTLRAALADVENILFWEAKKTWPSLKVIREKVLPDLYHIVSLPETALLLTDENKEHLAVCINLLKATLQYCTPSPGKVVSNIVKTPSIDFSTSGRPSKAALITGKIVESADTIATHFITFFTCRQSGANDTCVNSAVGHSAKQALVQSVVDPILYPEWFALSGLIPWRCILLYGPPGTGKTRLSQAIAREANTRFYQVEKNFKGE
ncbi:unnamed protein product [Gongylonema pulchrum]|uniref:ATPase_AAA_core domain-containing protein n=1 Tax=Gongylonema pulchrum TaxID=637853 RepID=A0A183E149_9BILA|nr:unnamed protein product [Gongylonema pulchrum]